MRARRAGHDPSPRSSRVSKPSTGAAPRSTSSGSSGVLPVSCRGRGTTTARVCRSTGTLSIVAWTGHAVRVTLTSRTFEVLAAFTPGRRSQRLADLAAATGLPLTTTHRIVGDLLRCGALERDPDGTLHVGLRLWEIGSLAPRGNALRDAALPFLEDLYVATRENVQLAVREGLESVFVERLTGRDAVTVMTRVGTRFPLASTGVGRALLAHAPTHVQEAALALPVRRWTPHTVTDPARLRAALAEVRRTGVAVSDREVTPTPCPSRHRSAAPTGTSSPPSPSSSTARPPPPSPSGRPSVPPRSGSPGRWAHRLPLCGTSSGATPHPRRRVQRTSHRLPPHRRDDQEDPRDRARRPRARDRQDLPAPPQRLVRRRVGPRGHRQGPHGPDRRRPAPGPLPHPGRTARRPRRRLLAPARAPVPGQARRP